MSRPGIRRPSAAMIVALLALVVALGGGAAAATWHVNGRNIINKSIAGRKLMNGTVGGTQLAANSVQTPKIHDHAVTAAKLAAGAVRPNQLATDGVTSEKIANGAVGRGQLSKKASVPAVQVKSSLSSLVNVGAQHSDGVSPLMTVVNMQSGGTTVSCDNNDVLMGGGVTTLEALSPEPIPHLDYDIIESAPSPSLPNTWSGKIYNTSGGDLHLIVYAVCAMTN